MTPSRDELPPGTPENPHSGRAAKRRPRAGRAVWTIAAARG